MCTLKYLELSSPLWYTTIISVLPTINKMIKLQLPLIRYYIGINTYFLFNGLIISNDLIIWSHLLEAFYLTVEYHLKVLNSFRNQKYQYGKETYLSE